MCVGGEGRSDVQGDGLASVQNKTNQTLFNLGYKHKFWVCCV